MIYQIWQWLHSHFICKTSINSITDGKGNRLYNSTSLFLFFLSIIDRCHFCHFPTKWPSAFMLKMKIQKLLWFFYQPALICPQMTVTFWYQHVLMGEMSKLWVGDKINHWWDSKQVKNKRINRLLTCRKKEFETFKLKEFLKTFKMH